MKQQTKIMKYHSNFLILQNKTIQILQKKIMNTTFFQILVSLLYQLKVVYNRRLYSPLKAFPRKL